MVALQDLISQLRRQITHTQERLPQLEEAKKAAVAGNYTCMYMYMYMLHTNTYTQSFFLSISCVCIRLGGCPVS